MMKYPNSDYRDVDKSDNVHVDNNREQEKTPSCQRDLMVLTICTCNTCN